MNPIDLGTIHSKARADWLARTEHSRTFIGFIMASQQYWLVIIGLVFFVLSASHTMNTFDRLVAPFYIGTLAIHPAFLAPFGIEFAILYTAFRRKHAEQHSEKVSGVLSGFEILMAVTSVVVNGAGALFVVVSYNGITKLSAGNILAGFGQLPAELQIALIIALAFAFIIPLSTHITGAGLATLVFEYNQGTDKRLSGWLAVERAEFYKAVYQWHLENGVTAGKSAKLADQLVRGYLAATSTTTAQPASTSHNHSTNFDQTQPTETIGGYVDYEEALRRYEERADWSGWVERDVAVEIGCSRHTARKIMASKKPPRLYPFPAPGSSISVEPVEQADDSE